MPMTREDKQAQAASVRETWNKANSATAERADEPGIATAPRAAPE